MKIITISILSLLLAGCGYVWFFAYDQNANASLDANVDVTSNEAIKAFLSDFAVDGGYKFIDQKMAVPTQNVISVYLERKDVLISATTVPNGDWLNVGFYKAKRKTKRPSDVTLNRLVNSMSNDLEAINGVEITQKNLSK